MPRIKLTKSVIDKIQPGPKQTDYFDTDLKGFGLRVGKDSRTFFCLKRVNGKPVRQTIGRFGPWTVEHARDQAKDYLRDMEKGIDPRAVNASTLTVKAAFNDYLQDRKLKASTRSMYEIFRSLLADWHDRPLCSITRSDVMQMFRKLTSIGATQANNTFTVFGAVWNHASAVHEDLPANPVKVLSLTRSWNPRKRRQGHLDPKRFQEFYLAIHRLSEGQRDGMLMVLYTGMRSSEVGGLLKEDIDFEGKVFVARDTKNHTDLALPMSKQVETILKRAGEASTGKYVFSRERGGKVLLYANALRRLGFDLTVHDLRRTFRNTCETLAIPPTTIKQLMNHSLLSDITDSYAVLSVEYLRTHVDRIGDYVERLLTGPS